MIHLDLFSGIGGFSYAADQVWDDVEHIFCDNNKFCQEVLKKHWEGSEIYDDIRAITNTRRKHGSEGSAESSHGKAPQWSSTAEKIERLGGVDLLTGGFPCQPFSQAGARRGTSDDRFLWPQMLRVIQLTKPTWVIAENVRGLLTIEQGVVFEQVCTDLEAEGYEVQPFVIPACAVNAPHRRDRVWIIAHTVNSRQGREKRNGIKTQEGVSQKHRTEYGTARKPERTDSDWRFDTSDWEKDWVEVAAQFCGVDDGLPDRSHRLKALGNSIVPQIAIEIMRGMVE